MICALTPEQTRILRRKVVKDLQKAIASDQPFTIEDYMKSMHKNVKTKTNNEELALAYASLVPTMINQIQANDPDTERKIYKGLRAKGISLDAIGDYISKYADTTNGLKSLQEDLGLTVDLAEEAKDMQESLDQENKQPPIGYDPPLASLTAAQLPPPDPNFDAKPVTQDEFNAKKSTVFGTADYESIEWQDKQSENYNVKDPIKAFYFKIQRMLLSLLGKPDTNFDSSKITIKNYPKEGVYLRLMPITKLDRAKVRAKDFESQPGRNQTFPSNWDNNEPVLVLTDVDGKPINLNEEGEYDENGKPAYYYFRRVYPDQISSDGKTVTRLSKIDERIADAKKRASNGQLTTQQAREAVMKELQMALDLRNKLKDNPNTFLRSRINGGSLGYLAENFKARSPIKAFLSSSQPVKFETMAEDDPSTGRKKNRTYFRTEETGNNYLEVERPAVTEVPGMVDKLINLFVGDLFVKKSPTLTALMRPDERLKLIKNFHYPQAGGLDFFVEADGSYKVKLRGKTIYRSLPTKRLNPQTQQYEEITAEASAQDKQANAAQAEEAAKKIKDYFNDLGPQGGEATNLTEEQKASAIKGTDPDAVKSQFKVGYIFQNTTTGKYYRVGQTKLGVPTNDAFLMPEIENIDGKLVTTLVPSQKSDFIRDNFSVKYLLDGQNKLAMINSYLTFDFIQDDINAAFPQETGSTEQSTPEALQQEVIESPAVTQTTVADTNALNNLDAALNDPELQKNMDQKNIDVKATKEQIAAAKEWYENHPMSKYIPFKVMFDMVNSRNKNTVATWTLNAITLYKGADFSDLYHEAWHGFTQAFMNKAQKDALYAEVESMSGSFTNYRGQRITFKDATYKALKQKKTLNTAEQNYVLNKEKEYEEYLAEDFRKWMLGGNKAKMEGAPVKRSLFQKILDFLKSLFSDASIDQIAGDTKALRNIHSLYEKMRVGNLSEYTYSESNTTFGMLDKGAEAFTNESGFKNLDYEESSRLVGFMDSIMSRFVDQFSEGKRKGQADNQLSYKWTSTLLKSGAGLRYAYKQVLEDFNNIKTGLEADLLQATEELEKIKIQRNLDRFNWAIANFGDVENLINNRPQKKGDWPKGLIGYHMMKSKILEPETKEAFFDEDVTSEEDLLMKGREGYDKGGNEISMKEMASTDILLALRSIHKVNKEGKPVYIEGTQTTITKDGVTSTVGVPELEDFDKVWNALVKILQNTMNAEVMYAKMLQYEKDHPEFPMSQIIKKFGPVSTKGSVEFNIWTNLWQTFNKSQVPLLQTTVEIVTKDNQGDAKKFENWGFSIKPGVANSQSRKIGFSWQGIFATVKNHPFIKPDEGGINYLDIKAVLSSYTYDKAVNKDPVGFLRAIGFFLEKDNADIERVIKEEKAVDTSKIYKALQTIEKRNVTSPKNAIKITRPRDITKSYPGEFVYDENGKVKRTSDGKKMYKVLEIFGEGRTYNDILEVEARYSNKHGNSGVTNAEGNTQFEHTLNNSLSIMVNALNDAKSYQDLMTMPWMRHLDIDRNPFAKASVWFNSMFNLDKNSPDFGKKRLDRYGKTVKMNLQNLSGVAMNKDGVFDFDLGVASAKADSATKLIMDFHLTLFKGSPELVRHADKGTSYSVFLNNIYVPGREFSRMYVDTVNFMNEIPGAGGVTDGDTQLLNGIILPHIGAELSRIQQMRTKKKEGFETFDVGYLNRGQGFVAFSFLSTKTKKALLKIEGDLSAYLNNGTEAARKLAQNIETDVYKYFNDQTAEVTKIFDKNKKQNGKDMISDNLAQSLLDSYKKLNDGSTLQKTDPKIKEALMKSFVVNSWVHNIESVSILYGDLAQYNMAKEEFHKRNAGMGSTGNLYRTDQAAIEYVNEVLKRPYQSKYVPNVEARTFDGTFNTAVLKDVEVRSAYIKDYAEALEQEEKDRLMSISKMSEEKATQEAKKKVYGYDKKTGKVGTVQDPIKGGLIHAYSEMNEGDGQGWISFDAYRIMLSLEGKWSDAQEKLYTKIINGEQVKASDVAQFFPTQKVQYFGPLQTDGLPIMAFHKFSLVPLIPTVIKDMRTRELHDKMVREGIDYALFQSGSKVGSITRAKKSEVDGKVSYKPEFDKLYSNDNRGFSQEPFVKNTIFLNFLKNQLEIAPKFKNKVIFSTQMRKLIEDGLVEGGVPTDFKTNLSLDERRKAWQALGSEQARLNESDTYKLYKAYEANVKKLTEIRMQELLDEMDWKMVNGEPQGSLENLLKFIKAEFRDRDDLAEHEIDFIDIGFGGKKVKHDFSMSLSAEKIEKMLNALVTRRLVKQKINGEALIQVSGAGFEDLSSLTSDRDYSNPTEADKEKWGTNDLPTYRKSADGTTAAMKVKISMQGKFLKLLDLTDKDGRRVGTRERLNALLKDEEWMNMGDNRRMVTMVGARIPVQGLNSMEFMEVYEFLPEEAGNIIIPPAEIVAKSGADFDIDKLTVMMPSYRYEKQADLSMKLTIAKQVSEKEARGLYDQAKTFLEKMQYLREQMPDVKDPMREISPIERRNLNQAFMDTKRMSDTLSQEVFGFTPEQLDEELVEMLVSEGKLDNFEDFYRKLNGGKAVENDLIWNMKEILALPSNYTNLIRPNGTELVKPLADELADKVSDYDPKAGVKGRMTAEEAEELGEDPNVIPGNRVLEVGYNLYKHASNNIGKQVLGLLAVGNTYNTILNRIGAYMSPTGKIVLNKKKARQGDNILEVRQTLLMDHNTLNINGEKAISLSHLFSVDGNRIADYISGLMNGAVDVAKDAWLFNVQGNKEIAPILEFLLSAGVAYDTAVLMVSQPIIREYVESQREYKGAFRDLTIDNPGSVMFFRNNARKDIFTNVAYGFISEAGMSSELIKKSDKKHLNSKTLEVTQRAFEQDGGKVNNEKMRSAIEEYSKAQKEGRTPEMDMEYQRAIFLHFLEIEEMAKAVRDVKMRMNFDTSKSDSLFDAQNRTLMLEELRENGRLPETLVDDILDNTVIGSFYVQPFQLKVWKDLFPLRNSQVLNDWLANKMREGILEDNEATFNDPELFVNSMRSDLVSFIFQNSIRSFDIDALTNYKGDTVEFKKLSPSILEGEKKAISSLKIGVFYKEGKVYVDKRSLREQFQNQDFEKNSYEELGLAKLTPGTIESEQEYYHFVFEREYLRTLYPNITSLENNTEYNWIKGQVKLNTQRLDGETIEAFAERTNRLSYETFLKEKALENIFNTNKIFKSDFSFGDKFLFIKENFKELFDNYSVLQKLGVSTAAEDSNNSFTNIQLLDTANDAETLNLYYENMLNLANPTVKKVPNAEDNQMISEFFANLPMVGFLQAGLSMKNKFNINRLMPQDRFLRFMEKPMKEYTEKLNPVVLDAFYQKFVEQNDKQLRGKTRNRFKNYYLPEFNLNTSLSESKKGVTEYNKAQFSKQMGYGEAMYVDQATGSVIYDPRFLKKPEDAVTLAQQNPDSVFVFNDAFLARSFDNSTGLDTRFKGAAITNKVGLPTYKYYNVGVQDKITDSELNSPDPSKNMKSKIDAAIEILKQHKAEGKTLVFSRTGYGLEMNNFPLMLRAKDQGGTYTFSTEAPETFLYLSEQLYKNFGYVNPGYQKLEQGIKVLQEYQDITDEEVLELMSKCYI